MSGTLLGKLRALKRVETTWSRWVQIWEQRSGRRIIERLRRTWQFDSRFEQLEPRQMLDATGGGTGSQPPEIEFSWLGLPTEVAELAAPFFDNGNTFSESSLSFPTEQIADNGDSPPVQNIFQVTATPWNNQQWADRLVTSAVDDNDGTTKLVQLRQLDNDNTLVLFRQITIGTTFTTSSGGGGGAGFGGGGSPPATENRSTDVYFVALVTDSTTAQSIQSSSSLVPLSPSLFGFTLTLENDFAYVRTNSSGNSNFTITNDLSVDMDINWTSDVTQLYEMGEEFDNDATLQVVTDAVASVNQTHHWVYTGRALASGDYSSSLPWSKSGSGTTAYSAMSGTVWDMNYSEGSVAEDDGMEFQFTVTEDFSTTASHTYNYSGSGTLSGDSMGGYQMATRNESFVRSGSSTTDDSPVTEFAYHSVGSNLELVEPDEGDGAGDGGEGGNGGGGEPPPPPPPIEMNVFHDNTITSTFSPVYQGDHDYTTTWTSLRASNGDWSESLVTNETNNFDTTGTVYSDTTSLNSISTSSRTGTEFHQLVDFTAASSAHTVVTTSSDMDFTGATGQEMVVSGTINVDSQVDNLVATTSLSSNVTINTMRVSGEYSDGVQALLPADWQGILGTIDTLGGAAVDWDWLGGGTVSALLLDMAITDYSSTENDFSSISPLTPPATPVSTYGTEMEFFIDGSIRFTSTGDSAWINGFSGTSDFGTKTVFVKGTAPDADTLDWMFSETISSDSSSHNGTFSSSDLENVTVTSTPEYDADPDPNSSSGSGGGSGGSSGGPGNITGYDSVVSGTTQRSVSSGSTYNNSNGGFVSSNARVDDYEGNKTDVSFSYLWQQQSTTTDAFTSGSWTTFGGIDGHFLTTTTVAGGNTSTAMPVDNYSISSQVRKETDDGYGGTSIDNVYSYQPWSGGGSFGVIWDQNTTLTLTETPIDLGEEDPEDPENPGEGSDEERTYLKITVTGDSNIWTTGDTNHDLDGDLAKLDVLKQIDSNPSWPNMPGNEPNQSWHDISNADQMTGNRTYTNTMHTRRVYTADGVDLITNGVERETWQNKARIPVDVGSEWELNDGAGTITERTIQEDGFLIAESKGDIKTTATDWTVSIRDTEDPEGSASGTGPLSGNQIYNRGGSEVRVSGQIETVEDLKNTSKYDTVWTLEEEMTATGQNNYHGSGERFDTVVTHNDASERSIRTTTVIASNIPATESTPDGSTLVEVVTLELPGADNTTTFDVTREGTYEQRFISTNTSTGTVHVNALEGSYNGSYVGNSVNEVLNGTLTTTRHANGNITVDGSIEARTHTVADVEASANSFWVDGFKSNSQVDPPGQSDLSYYTDDALAAAGGGPNSGGLYGEYNRFDVGEVVSRQIDTHFVLDETFEWTRVAVDQDNDGIHEWVQDTGPIKTETIEVTGIDTREIHHWGVDQVGPYDQTVIQETDAATATNPAGFVNKAARLRGDNSLPGRISTYGGNEPPPVDDEGSDLAEFGTGGSTQEPVGGQTGREVPLDRLRDITGNSSNYGLLEEFTTGNYITEIWGDGGYRNGRDRGIVVIRYYRGTYLYRLFWGEIRDFEDSNEIRVEDDATGSDTLDAIKSQLRRGIPLGSIVRSIPANAGVTAEAGLFIAGIFVPGPDDLVWGFLGLRIAGRQVFRGSTELTGDALKAELRAVADVAIGGSRGIRGIDGLPNASNFVPGKLQPRPDTCGPHCAYDALQELGSKAKFEVGSEIRELIRKQGGLEKRDLEKLIESIDDSVSAIVREGVDSGSIASSLARGPVIAFVDGNHWVRVISIFEKDGHKYVRVFDSARGGYYDQLFDSFFTRMGANNAIINIVN